MSKTKKAKPVSPSDKPPGRATGLLGLAAMVVGVILVATGTATKRIPVLVVLPKFPESSRVSFHREDIGAATTAAKRTTNVQMVDFDKDGQMDILVCDAARNAVVLYRRTKDHRFAEQVLGENLMVPAHATAVDIDKDGDLDVVVSVLGNIFPSDELIGKVVLLRNDGGRFTQKMLLEDVRRVADAQPADFDRDGDIDLVVAVFGYARGEVLMLENLGDGTFRDRVLLAKPGIIHVPVGDLNGDGFPDIAAVATQDEEEVWTLINDGKGRFTPSRVYFNNNYDVGGAALVMADLDKDGDPDLILPQGDNLEDRYSWPQGYHGCVWLENSGNGTFKPHQIAQFGGTYAAAVAEFDGDGDLDVVLVSYLTDPMTPSIVWLENDGRQNFTTHQLDTAPVGLVTVAAGDLNGDGKADVVAGGLHLPPMSSKGFERVPVWMSKGGAK